MFFLKFFVIYLVKISLVTVNNCLCMYVKTDNRMYKEGEGSLKIICYMQTHN